MYNRVFNNIGTPNNKINLRYKSGYNRDIITTIENSEKEAIQQAQGIAYEFKGDTIKNSSLKIFDFLKNEIKYKVDSEGKQVIQLPKYLVANRKNGADCKSFTLFTNAILSNLYPNNPIFFRYASYDLADKTPSHVYAVILDENNREIIIDAVYGIFNEQKPAQYILNKRMKIYTISGIGNNGVNGWWQDAIHSAQDFASSVSNTWNGLTSQAQAQFQAQETQLAQAKIQIKKRFDSIQNKFPGLTEKIKDDLSDIKKWNLKDALKFVYNRLSVGPALAVPRGAFLGLVKMNFRLLPYQLAQAIVKDEARVKRTWFALGGDFEQLKKTIIEGKKVKMIGGVGEAYTIGALISAGASITGVILNMLMQMGIFKKGGKNQTEANNYIASQGVNPDKFAETFVAPPTTPEEIQTKKRNTTLLTLGAIGTGAYFLLK